MSEKLSLKWNDFQSNVSNSFSLLRNEDYLHDVTLVTDDEENISAHKVVLAASSGFFKNILTKTSHANPLLYLNGIKSKELHFIMEYIYNGKVEIYQTDIENFINVAQKLRVEGLDALEEDPNINETLEELNDNVEPDTKSEKKWPKTIILIGIYCILGIDIVANHQNLGIIL